MASSELLIVCGPIVRRVDQSSASVFVVTRQRRAVTLTVYENNAGKTGQEVMRGERETIALGEHLHAVVVTARGDNALAWGASYHYDLTFSEGDHQQSLRDDGVLVASQTSASLVERLVYEGQERSGFVLPPADPADLRVLHGSCRKPHGDGDDALARIDELIADALGSPGTLRPQQLFFTGDQIYADDVDPKLLAGLRAFAHRAIGRAEEDTDLKGYSSSGQLNPGRRKGLCKEAKLSSTACASHLVTLGEFYAMYLSVWSLEPWQDSQDGQTARGELPEFTTQLPSVRRALANIATYMVPDDHEVTDDWYIRETWCDEVLDHSLGRRIVRNGLAAYVVFQHWGNDPDQATPKHPLGRALAAIDGWNGTAATLGELDAILPVPARGADLASPSPERLDLAWRWRGPAYEVIGLDTRTRRQFPKHKVSLMSANEIDRVLGDGPIPPFTIVLSAAPVLGVQLLETVQNMVKFKKWTDKFDVEPWSNGETYQHLLSRLLERSPVLALSGDVHYGFGASLSKKSDRDTRVVNFVSSALKNMPSAGLRDALKALGIFNDNHVRKTDRSLVLDAQLERTIEGQAFEEEVMLYVDEPSSERADSRSEDRTKITGYCNVGEVRLRPDRDQAIQVLWHKPEQKWQQTEHTARFKLNRAP